MLQTQRAELIRGVFEPPGMFYDGVQRDACETLAEVVRSRGALLSKAAPPFADGRH